MRKLVLAIGLSFSLGACATFGSVINPITPNRMAAIEGIYGIVLSAAVAYRDACARRVIVRSTCGPVVLQLQTYGRTAQRSVVTARNFIRANPTLDAGSVISAASIAVGEFHAVAAQNGVQ